MILHHYQKDQSCHAKAQADASEKETHRPSTDAGKKRQLDHSLVM